MKKKPESQKALGLPLSIRLWRKSSRSCRSFTYDPSGFSDGYDTLAHAAGTLPISIELKMPSSSVDIYETTRRRIL